MSGWKVEFLEVARDEFADWPDELKAGKTPRRLIELALQRAEQMQ